MENMDGGDSLGWGQIATMATAGLTAVTAAIWKLVPKREHKSQRGSRSISERIVKIESDNEGCERHRASLEKNQSEIMRSIGELRNSVDKKLDNINNHLLNIVNRK